MLIAALLGTWWWNTDDTSAARRDWQPPPEALLSSSMGAPPVPGWQTTVDQLGLPANSRIATKDRPARSKPFIGYLGGHGYFLATAPGADGLDWWLVGVDVRDGAPLFPALPLTTATTTPPECYLNGPTMVLCLKSDGEGHTAWVVDAATGNVTFTGPTDLNISFGPLKVEQVGIYAVAGTQHEGVYGLGPRAEPTWFVPGSGSADQQYRPRSTTESPPLATQASGAALGLHRVVFSLVDGAIMSPPMDGTHRAIGAIVYPGGFAIETVETAMATSNPEEIWFFTDTGEQMRRVDLRGKLAADSWDIPIVESRGETTVFTPDGRPLADLRHSDFVTRARLIGPRLFVSEGQSSAFPEWAQYDLHTGEPGPTCEFNIGDYLGTDGEVAVLRVYNSGAPVVLRAADLDTCEILWRLPKEPDSFGHVWRVNTTLVRLSDDGTALMSLVAP